MQQSIISRKKKPYIKIAALRVRCKFLGPKVKRSDDLHTWHASDGGVFWNERSALIHALRCHEAKLQMLDFKRICSSAVAK